MKVSNSTVRSQICLDWERELLPNVQWHHDHILIIIIWGMKCMSHWYCLLVQYIWREREREREREKKFAMPWHHHLLNIWGMIESVIASPCDCTLDLLYLLWWLKPNLKQISYMVHGRLRSTQWLKLPIVVFMTTKKGSWRLQHNLDLKVPCKISR